ncbi:hypothetical protein TNCT_478441 [Trichonephila clavata]|uniref:Uncharacterized protein n=1 Tax=Trichonephila clavata TaxID=2740835 RepID=A0A8X6LG55_TRICU|nr:hypothetical protein TNCT_478441 [Trichonephila clavata]
MLAEYKFGGQTHCKIGMVIYENKVVRCGAYVDTFKTFEPPTLDYPAYNTELYTLMMFHFDQGSPTPKLFNFLHWLVVNIPDNNVSEGTTKVAYATTEVPLKGIL